MQKENTIRTNSCHHDHCHDHNHDDHNHQSISERTIKGLYLAFFINICLTFVEIGFGIFADSIALIGDGLHNTSDAFSILIAIIAYKIATNKSNEKYSYGFKRAETIGGFVNLILLFISGTYLLFEGFRRIINPEYIDGKIIIIVSVIALIVDLATAKLSHDHSHHNTNMKMLFIHNLADAFGSIGVIISGLFVVFFQWNFVDGLVAIMIALYMLFQAIYSFSDITNILMNATPKGFDLEKIKNTILNINGVQDIHHIHLWNINENDASFECHVVGKDLTLLNEIKNVLKNDFGILHSNIQIEENICNSEKCTL